MSVRDRWVVLTGGTSGIGLEAARLLVRRGIPVLITGRNPDRGRAARSLLEAEAPGVPVRLELCDLGDLDEVRRLGERILQAGLPLRGLLNNAGLHLPRLEHSPQGFERTLASNHLGHFLLTRILEEPLRAGRARIVNVSSGAHRYARWDRGATGAILRGTRPYLGPLAYANSKLANLLFGRGLAERWGSDVTVHGLHPGVLATSIWDRNGRWATRLLSGLKPRMEGPEAGGRALAALAIDPAFGSGDGGYFRQTHPQRPSANALDPELSRELWEFSSVAAGLPGGRRASTPPGRSRPPGGHPG